MLANLTVTEQALLRRLLMQALANLTADWEETCRGIPFLTIYLAG